MHPLSLLLLNNEQWLMSRILSYATRQNYTKYTSTLLDAWRLSISGITDALTSSLENNGDAEPQFSPEDDYTADPITDFARLEAKRHRERGINLGMFQGLLKYYRDTYIDLINEKAAKKHHRGWSRFILRTFDRIELALCMEWAATDSTTRIEELQIATRRLTNEKNKYLTIFESTPRPVFLVDRDGLVDSLNLPAARLLGLSDTSGAIYYSGGHSTLDRKAAGLCTPFKEMLPWLEQESAEFLRGTLSRHRIEIKTSAFGELRYFEVIFASMQDVSGKFSGMIVVLEDISGRKHMEQELNRLATIDSLTESYNRHQLIKLGQQELSRSMRYSRALAVLMLDIDYFKAINDKYGHAAGDDVLRALSSICKATFRLTDIFGRLGGEEFAAFLPETTLDEAVLVAERLRNSIAHLVVKARNDQVRFTVSIGVAKYKENQSLEEVLAVADKALYMAKDQGRNRVVAIDS